MQRYRFIGSYMEIGDKVFSRFGQIADWDEEYYRSIVGRSPFIPETQFKKIPFDEQELGNWADYGNRSIAPDSFNARVEECLTVWRDVCDRLRRRPIGEELESVPELQ